MKRAAPKNLPMAQTPMAIQNGVENHPCGCVTNPRGAREGLQLFHPCSAVREAYEIYRYKARNSFGSSLERAQAQQEWGRIADHIKAQRSGKAAKGATGKGRTVEYNWGDGEK